MTNIIFIHGVNSQLTGYSSGLYHKILKFFKEGLKKKKISKAEISQRAQDIVQKEILWAHKTTNLTNRYLTLQHGIKKREGKWNMLTKVIDPLIIQILHYVKDKGSKKNGTMGILKTIHNQFEVLDVNKSQKTIIIAHSLGSVIAFDYIFGFRKHKLSHKINVEAFITLGSPIPIFMSAMRHVESKIKLPKNVKRWINILDPDDGVARYCDQYFKNISVQDVSINTGWDCLRSHVNYWKTPKVAEFIAKELIKIA